MTKLNGNPAAGPAATSPIGALIARAAHAMERSTRLEIMGYANAVDERQAKQWEDAVMDEYFILEDAVLHSEPGSIGEAIAMVLVAIGKLGTVIADIQPPLNGEVDPDYDERPHKRALLIDAGLTAAAGLLIREFRDQLPPGTDEIVNLPAMENRHGPALAALPSEAELEAARPKRRAGSTATAAATPAVKGGAQ